MSQDQEINLNVLTGEKKKVSPKIQQQPRRTIHPEDHLESQTFQTHLQDDDSHTVQRPKPKVEIPETKVFDLVSGQHITQIEAPAEPVKPKAPVQTRPTERRRPVVSSPERRRVLSADELQNRTAKKEVEQPPKDMKQKAYNMLDESIKRKQEEFNEAMSFMIERDKENRILVSEGVETVVGEVDYLPLDPDKHEDESLEKKSEEELFDIELERELDIAEDNARAVPSKNITIKSPFGQNETKGDTQMNDTERFDITPKIRRSEPKEPVAPIIPTYEEEIEKTKGQKRPLNVSDFDLGELPDDEILEDEEIDEIVEDDIVTPDDLFDQDDDESFKIEDSYEEPEDEEVIEEVEVEVTSEPLATEEPVEEQEETVVETSAEEFFKNHMAISKPLDSAIKDTDISQTDFDINEEDFAELDDADEALTKKGEEERAKKIYDKYRSEILQKVVNTASNINVSGFKVSKKVGSLQSILNKAHKEESQAESVSTWPLMNAGRPYMASALTGPEIVMLTDIDEGQSTVNANLQQTKILYNHDANPNKPASFNAWCKTIPYADLDEVFMAIYIATFRKANYIPYYCTSQKCSNMELQEQKSITKNMVKFANDKQKERFNKIRETALTQEMSGEYETTVIPINSYIAIGFRLPSLYNMIVELRSLDNKFLTKYAAVVTVMMYIDSIYEIDNGELKLIQWKEYPDNITKEVKSKIATYARILNTLSTSEYSVLVTYIGTLNKVENSLNYIIPESKCSECGTKIEERQTTGKELVFIYQHLMNIASTSAV